MNTQNKIPEIDDSVQKAWVVFSGQTDLPWLKLLKPGFRHCYVILNDGAHWVTMDPLSNYMDIVVHKIPQDFDLPLWMKTRGHVILPARITHKTKQAPWMIFTCVEAVKRVIGLHSRRILTPWQLYRHLNKHSHIPTSDFKGDIAWEA